MRVNGWQKALARTLHRGGVEEGQTILVHSSFKALKLPGTPDDVVEALLAAVGADGTLAVPTHTWGVVNARQPVFDVLYSPSHVGIITECLRRRPQTVRSLHPTHSVAAIGPCASAMVEGHENHDTPCSRTSPYGRVVDWGGCIVMLGISLACNTTYHGLEEWIQVPWVFQQGVYEDLYSVDAEGRRIHVPSMRHSNVARAYEATEGPLEQEGILKRIPWGDASILVVQAKPMAEYIGNRLASDNDYLLKVPPA